MKLDCSASVYSPFHSLISVFRDDEFGLHSQCSRKIADKMGFHLKHLNFMKKTKKLALPIALEYCEYK